MKRTIKGYVVYRREPWMSSPELDFLTFDPRGKTSFESYVVVKTQEIEIEAPDDFDPRPEQIKNLEAQQQKARADFERLCTDIQRQISELTCLEAS